MTPTSPAASGAAPPAPGASAAVPTQPGPTGPTHGCARCGAPVAMGVGLCERCNPLGLRDVAASQAHGTVFIGIAVAFVLLALLAQLAVSGVGPFPSMLGTVVPDGDALRVTLTVTNEGSAAGGTTCRVTTAANRGGGPSAFVLSPNLEPGETATFSQLITELGTDDTALVAECRAP